MKGCACKPKYTFDAPSSIKGSCRDKLTVQSLNSSLQLLALEATFPAAEYSCRTACRPYAAQDIGQ